MAGRALRALIAAALLVPLLILGGGGAIAWRDSWRQAERELGRSADALAEYALRVLDGHRVLLDRTADVLRGLTDEEVRAQEEELHQELRAAAAPLTQVLTVFALDRHGRTLVASDRFPLPRDLDLSDWDVHAALAMPAAPPLHVGKTRPDQSRGQGTFSLARRRTGSGNPPAPEGFDGTFVVLLRPERVAEGFARLAGGESGDGFALVHTDGRPLAVHSAPGVAPSPPLPPQSPLSKAAATGADRVVFVVHGADGGRRLAVARRVEGWPVYAVAERTRAKVVEQWASTVLAQFAVVLPGALALAAIALAALRGAVRERDALAALRAEAARRENAEAALQRSRRLEALGQLTGGVAHDFNNLLQVISSGLALLQRSPPDSPRGEVALAAMRQAAERGGRLTQQLLAFARRQPLAPQPLDLPQRLAAVRELLERSLRGDIRLEICLPTHLWRAQADPTQLEVALLNLAVNGRDAMPRGGVLTMAAANVTLAPGADPDGLSGDFVRLSVHDTGEGMPPDVLARAFEPFFTTKERGRGTGLGLAQVYGFARQSGGAARIESERGRGTTVHLLLPRAEGQEVGADDGITATTSADASSTGAEPKGARALSVLVVEDDAEVGAMTEELLHQLGHSTTRVVTAEAALGALADGRQIDLLLTDVVIPGGRDGLELALETLRRRPGLPVLLASGFAGAPDRVAASGLPLLRKPYSLDDLRRAIELAAPHRPTPSASGAASPSPMAASPSQQLDLVGF